MQCKIRKIYIILLFIMEITFALICIYKKVSEDRVKLIKSESFFDEFYVKEDKVFIKCYLTIQNNSGNDEYINLSANLKGDAINGLLKSPVVYGFDEKGSDKFFIKENSTQEYNVIFIGDFANKPQKLTRNLPPIEIKVIND